MANDGKERGMTTKVCKTCKMQKNMTEFSGNKQTKDKLQPMCKKCAVAKTQAWIPHMAKKPKVKPLTFGQWMRRERIARGWTCKEASDAIGTSRSYVWELEHRISEPGLIMALKVARAFDKTLGSILQELEME